MSKKIFISYDYDNDKHYKNLLLAWDSNKEFDFNFYDTSIDVSVNSKDVSYIKSVIKERIKASSIFLLLVGEKTSKSNWIEWEINTAIELQKELVAVKIDNEYSPPSNIYGHGASWAKSFTFDAIKKAIE
jgi:hypothetical protein